MERGNRISRTLYKQLIQYCQVLEKEKFPHDVLKYFLDPATLRAPKQIDMYSTEMLHGLSIGYDLDSRVERVYMNFPPSTLYEADQVTLGIETHQDLKGAIRGLFRMNRLPSEWDKQRRDLAFENLKFLNDLYVNQLKPLQAVHNSNVVTTFKVGEVVLHKHHRWRGVIVSKQGATTAPTLSDDFSKTSLTNKMYSIKETTYEILVDASDVYKLTGSLELKSVDALESDLELVHDPQLLRIRNEAIWDYFDRFCGTRFIPNSIKSYEFPSDASDVVVYECPELIQTCDDIISSILDCAKELEGILLEVNKQQTTPQPSLSVLWRQLMRISVGILDSESLDHSKVTRATRYLKNFTDLSVSLFETSFQREHRLGASVNFKLGDVITHKRFGFRGLVVAWDPEPTIDVSNWDGLVEIEDPHSRPFYRVLVDRDTEYYGNSIRYVCEDNMELSSGSVDVDVEKGWILKDNKYVPSENARFLHGEDMGDEGCLFDTIIQIREKINAWQASVRSRLVPQLLTLLHSVCTEAEADAIQEAIQELRKSNRIELRRQFERGIAEVSAQRVKMALDTFNDIVEKDPEYSVALEKLGLCQLLAGNLNAATVSTKKSLELDDRSMGMVTLGLIELQRKNYEAAEGWFRKILKDIDPWSQASSTLLVCLDLKNQEKS